MLARERRPMPAGILPPSAPLPNLRDALARRAAVFGPYDGNEATAQRGPVRLGTLARRVVAALDLRRVS